MSRVYAKNINLSRLQTAISGTSVKDKTQENGLHLLE